MDNKQAAKVLHDDMYRIAHDDFVEVPTTKALTQFLDGITNDKIEELKNALRDLAQNTDEDCPAEYRSKHLRESLRESFELTK